MAKPPRDEVPAPRGERMIEVKLRFWTNNIAERRGYVVPKHAWASGMIVIESNPVHGIRSKKSIPFHTLLDLPAVIEKSLTMHGIELHTSRKMKKYFSDRRRTDWK